MKGYNCKGKIHGKNKPVDFSLIQMLKSVIQPSNQIPILRVKKRSFTASGVGTKNLLLPANQKRYSFYFHQFPFPGGFDLFFYGPQSEEFEFFDQSNTQVVHMLHTDYADVIPFEWRIETAGATTVTVVELYY